MSYVYLPQRAGSGKNWTITKYYLGQEKIPLENIFLEYLLVETSDAELRELDDYISYMDETFDERNETYTQATINKFKTMCKSALNKVKNMDLGNILNKQPYDNKIIEESKKLREQFKEEGKSIDTDEYKDSLKLIEEKYNAPFDFIRLFLPEIDGLDDVFPYDIDEVGNVTERDILNELEEVIDKHPMFKVKDVQVPSKRKGDTLREQRVGALTPSKRAAQDKFFAFLEGGKDVQVMDINKEFNRFKEQKKLSEKIELNKNEFQFEFTLEEDEKSKREFLKELNIDFDTITEKTSKKNSYRVTTAIEIPSDSQIIRYLQVYLFGYEIKEGKEPKEVDKDLTKAQKEDMAKIFMNIIQKTIDPEKLIPNESLNPILADVELEVEVSIKFKDIKRQQVLEGKKLELDKVNLSINTSYSTLFYMPQAGVKFYQQTILTGEKRDMEKITEPLRWQKGELTPKMEKEGIKVGDEKKWSQGKVTDIKTGRPISVSKIPQFLTTIVYPEDLPENHPRYNDIGSSPNMNHERYAMQFYDTPKLYELEEDEMMGVEEKEKEEKTSKTKAKRGIKIKDVAYKIDRYFDQIEKRLNELEEAVSKMEHEPVEVE
tara:strand:+ start:49 stop:1857 length:1809 start_codon:yes stop_codon:yes gene_type:complete